MSRADLYRRRVKSARAMAEQMIDLVAELEAEPGGGQALERFLATRHRPFPQFDPGKRYAKMEYWTDLYNYLYFETQRITLLICKLKRHNDLVFLDALERGWD